MIKVEKVGFGFAEASERILDDVSLALEPYERICVLGPTGSGKTVLAELAAGLRAPDAGSVDRDGTVAYLGHDPRAGMVSTLVFDEVAFGLRCAGLSGKAVKGRATAALRRCGINHLAHSSTSELSASQQQLVALAAAIAVDPDFLVLDDPFALLDGTSAKLVATIIDDMVQAGVGVLETSSALERAMGADRTVLLGAGHRAWSGSFDDLLASDELLGRLGITDAADMVLLRAVSHEGFRFASCTKPDDIISFIKDNNLAPRIARSITPARGDATFTPAHKISLVDASVVYGTHAALGNVSLSVGDELVLVAGPAGSGTSTLAAALAGALPLDGGEVQLDGERIRPGRAGYLGGFPKDQLFSKTVRGAIAYGLEDSSKRGGTVDTDVTHAAGALGITGLLDRDPRTLSSGEQRLAVLAGIEALRPDAAVLDNPCAGLDAAGRARVHRMVQRMRSKHLPVIIVTGDVEEWLADASRMVFMRDGALGYDCDGGAVQTRTQPYVSCGVEPPLTVSVRSLAGMGTRRRDARG